MLELSPKLLFQSGAFQVSEPDKPFLYTSGLIGPFYINTHFLCGGKEGSEAELLYLDNTASEPERIVAEFPERLEALIKSSETYSSVIDKMVQVLGDFEYSPSTHFVSGGQRRDWFFSVPIAKRLGLPHIYLFNDGLVLDEERKKVESLSGKKSVHLADLLTAGSSYTAKWIPYLKSLGASMELAYNCVDRLQGGVHNLTSAGVSKVISLFDIDKSFFNQALELGIINSGQLNMISAFLADNKESMREFLLAHPEFLKNILASGDEKSKKRVGQMLEGNLYDFSEEYMGGLLR